ncbi:TPA: hypothetical protein ACNUS5_002514 [Vibrio cholerae]
MNTQNSSVQINEFAHAVALAGIVNLTTGEVIKTVTDIQQKASLYQEVKDLAQVVPGELTVFGFDSRTEVLIDSLEKSLGAKSVLHLKYLHAQYKVMKITHQLTFEEQQLEVMKQARSECLAYYKESSFLSDIPKASLTRKVFNDGINALESLVDSLKIQIGMYKLDMNKIMNKMQVLENGQ